MSLKTRGHTGTLWLDLRVEDSQLRGVAWRAGRRFDIDVTLPFEAGELDPDLRVALLADGTAVCVQPVHDHPLTPGTAWYPTAAEGYDVAAWLLVGGEPCETEPYCISCHRVPEDGELEAGYDGRPTPCPHCETISDLLARADLQRREITGLQRRGREVSQHERTLADTTAALEAVTVELEAVHRRQAKARPELVASAHAADLRAAYEKSRRPKNLGDSRGSIRA